MKKLIVLVLCFVLISIFSSGLSLASIYTCDAEGNEKTKFYANETVYVASLENITIEAKTIKFYVVVHGDWEFGTNLTQIANLSKNISTNSSGHVPVVLFWGPTLEVGVYDLIADMNGNSAYDSGDLIYDADGSGFSVEEEPVPTLKVYKGENSPSDHDWYLEANASEPNMMLQTVLKAGNYEGIVVNTIYLSAFGTGDDKTNINYVAVCLDSNRDGKCEGESIIGFGKYQRDDGIVNIDTRGKLLIAKSSVVHLAFYYMMKNYSGSIEGETYDFQLVMVDAFGSETGGLARISGLPIQSATKKVYPQVASTTTTSTSTTTILVTTSTTIPEKEEERVNLFVGLSVVIFAAVAIIIIIYFFFLRHRPQTYQYKPQI